MCYSLWYKAPTMLPAGSLEAELRHTGLLTACEQEHLPATVLLHLVGCLYYLYQ